MGTYLGNDAALYHHDLVGLENGREAVRNHDARAANHELLEGLLDGVFADGVKGARRLVENQDLGVLQHHARQRQTLLLAARKLQATVAHLRLVAVGLRHDEVVDVGHAARRLNLFHAGVWLGVEQVVKNGAVEEVRLLRHHTHALPQVGQVKVAHVHARHAYAARVDVIQAWDEVDHRRLARAAGAHDGVHLPAGDGEVDVGQHEVVRGLVAKGHVLVGDGGHLAVRTLAVLGRDDAALAVKVVKDPCEHGQRPREAHLQVEQTFHRAVQAVDERDRGGDGTHRKCRVKPANDEEAAGKVDEQRPELRKHAHYHAEPRARALLLQRERRDLLVDAHEALVLAVLGREHLHQKRARDGERLVDKLVHLVVLGLALKQQFEAHLAGAAGRQDEQRKHEDADYGQLGAHGEERHQRGDHGGDVAHDLRERARDDGADARDVGVHARDDVALLLGGEKRMRHALQVLVHLVLHVEDDAHRDPRVDVVLEHTHQLAGQHGGKRREKQADEQAEVVAYEGGVNDAAGDDRRQEANHC